jgi:hypothetical protein
MFLDDSACNLASLNLMKFVGADGEFDVGGASATRSASTDHGAGDHRRQRQLPDRRQIEKNSHAFRPLGLGYANLGALLMSRAALRQRRGPRLCRRHHGGDDRRGLRPARGSPATTAARSPGIPTTASRSCG